MAINRVGNTVDVSIPAFIYELLPLLYIAGGFLAAAKIGGALVNLCSVVLILTGVQILRMRSRYRESMKFPQRNPVRSRS